MALLFSVSTNALAFRPCDAGERAAASDTCSEIPGGAHELRECYVTNYTSDSSWQTWANCCIPGTVDCHGEWLLSADGHGIPEDDERDDPFAPSSTPEDEGDSVDRESDSSDDDELRDDEDSVTDEDSLESDETDEEADTGDADEEADTGDADEEADTGDADEEADTGDADGTSTDDDETPSVGGTDEAADAESNASKTGKGCSTVGQTHGGLVAVILGALMGLTRRQVRWN